MKILECMKDIFFTTSAHSNSTIGTALLIALNLNAHILRMKSKDEEVHKRKLNRESIQEIQTIKDTKNYCVLVD